MKRYAIILLVLIGCSKENEPVSMIDPPIENPMAIIDTIASFPNEIHECSGLIMIDGRLISMNDGPQHTTLHEVDDTDATINRDIHIAQIQNVDWECIQYDSGNIYIGDTGNNFGTRMSLEIYTIPYDGSDTLSCVDTLSFIWPDQDDFTSSNSHPYDCEAMIVEDQQVILFTKNRNNLQSNVYRLDLTDGNITRGETIELFGLITDAVRDPSGEVLLLSYFPFGGSFSTHLHRISEVNGAYTLIETINLSLTSQIEAIVHTHDHFYLIGSEAQGSLQGNLYAIDLHEYYE